MTPLLLAPLGLAALAALIGPLLIHLRRRTEEVPVDFAALRWLDPRPRPRQRLQFDEWPLLALRLLLVALLALLLARPAVPPPSFTTHHMPWRTWLTWAAVRPASVIRFERTRGGSC